MVDAARFHISECTQQGLPIGDMGKHTELFIEPELDELLDDTIQNPDFGFARVVQYGDRYFLIVKGKVSDPHFICFHSVRSYFYER